MGDTPHGAPTRPFRPRSSHHSKPTSPRARAADVPPENADLLKGLLDLDAELERELDACLDPEVLQARLDAQFFGVRASVMDRVILLILLRRYNAALAALTA